MKQRPLNLNIPLIKCRCGKTYSPTRAAAIKTRKHVAEKNGGSNPVRFYECRYKSWHWTSQVHPVRRCFTCHGMFRGTDQDPAPRECPDCIRRAEVALLEARAAKVEAEAARLRRLEETRDRIIKETRPTPTLLAKKRTADG